MARKKKVEVVPVEMELSETERVENVYPLFIHWRTKILGPEDPQNEGEFARVHSISTDQIGEWKRKESFADDVVKAALAWGRARVPELLHQLYDIVRTEKSASSIEKYMNIISQLEENQKKEGSGNTFNQINVFGISDEKLKRIAARTLGTGNPSLPGQGGAGQAR